MNKTRNDYENDNLDELFKDHLKVIEWKERKLDYNEKLLTLGFQSYIKKLTIHDFIKFIGNPDLADIIDGSGQFCYLTPDEKYVGWCWIFHARDFIVKGFGTNGYNIKFYQGTDGSPKYIHEVMSVFKGI